LELSCIRQLIEEDKFGKDEDICPHSLKKKSQRCGATLSLVKDQFGEKLEERRKKVDVGKLPNHVNLVSCCHLFIFL
jgi:hypothetical protein